MNDIITIAIVVAVLAIAVLYIVRQKKKGVKCIGCEHGKSCSQKSCGCGSQDSK